MFFEENGIPIKWNPPEIMGVNREVLNMYSLIGHNVIRDKDKNVIGLDTNYILQGLQYFQIPPEKSEQYVENLNYITKIVNGGR